MLKFRGRRIAVIGALVAVAILTAVFAVSVLDKDEPEPRTMTLKGLGEADIDRIVVQLQDPRVDRLTASVVDDYRDTMVLTGDGPADSREPLVLQSDNDGEIWDNELLAGAIGVTVVAALFLTWRTLRLRREQGS